MYEGDQLLDSYQNPVGDRSGNQSVEGVGPGQDGDSVEHAAGQDPSGREEGETEERGRAASGESYEDEADDALFRPQHKEKAVTTDTWDGGNIGPGGRVIERAKGKK